MPTQQQTEAINLYAALMEEVKVRMVFVQKASAGGLFVHTQIVRETCYLQLRLLCELIALGCLVAHGDIKSVREKSLSKEYAADKIVKALDRLHPSFYPIPVRSTVAIIDGRRNHRHQLLDGQYLTKEHLTNLYVRCGDFLHRGSIKKLLKAQAPTEHTRDVSEWLNKIGALLGYHQIALLDGSTYFLCKLVVPEFGGRCQVIIAETIES